MCGSILTHCVKCLLCPLPRSVIAYRQTVEHVACSWLQGSVWLMDCSIGTDHSSGSPSSGGGQGLLAWVELGLHRTDRFHIIHADIRQTCIISFSLCLSTSDPPLASPWMTYSSSHLSACAIWDPLLWAMWEDIAWALWSWYAIDMGTDRGKETNVAVSWSDIIKGHRCCPQISGAHWMAFGHVHARRPTNACVFNSKQEKCVAAKCNLYIKRQLKSIFLSTHT